jgi:hypothetical protein
MKTTLAPVVSLIALLCCGCSSSSNGGTTGTGTGTDGGSTGNTTCTATSSGGWSGTIPCTVGGVHSAQGDTSHVDISSPDGSDGISIVIDYQGASTAGTYNAAKVLGSLGDFKSTDKSSEWEEQAANGADTEGTFTLVLSSIGDSTPVGGSGDLGYSAMHGTFTGTFVAKSGGTGTSTLNITF